MQGAFFIVAATNPARRQVIVTATSYKAVIGRGDVLTGFTNVSQSLGSVRPNPYGAHAPALQMCSSDNGSLGLLRGPMLQHCRCAAVSLGALCLLPEQAGQGCTAIIN